LRQAIERLERAVELRPDFAAAWAELADCNALLNWFVEPPPPEAWQRAKQAALQAVSADPLLAEAHASLGFVRLHYDRNWKDAQNELRKAITLNPKNLVSHRWYAYSLSAMGRHQEAVVEIERAREISPQFPVTPEGRARLPFSLRCGSWETRGVSCQQPSRRWAADCSLTCEGRRRKIVEKLGAPWPPSIRREFSPAIRQRRALSAHTCWRPRDTSNRHMSYSMRSSASVAKNGSRLTKSPSFTACWTIATALLCGWTKLIEHAVGLLARVDPHLENLRADPRFRQLLSAANESLS
jgi:hypothetical protein